MTRRQGVLIQSLQTRRRRDNLSHTTLGPERLEPRVVLDARVLITEVVASNDQGLKDDDKDRSDWIELYNAGDTPADLNGWHLTDDAREPTKWTFPSVTIQPQQYLVVFASGKDRANPAAPLHTNFQLSVSGEYLGLVQADGSTVAFEFAPVPPLQPDRAYGLTQATVDSLVVESPQDVRAFVPTPQNGGDALGTTWTAADFDDAVWVHGSRGVGFDAGAGDFAEFIGTDIEAQMLAVNATAYVRIPFTVEDPAAYFSLVLRVQYDDGFIAYVNGQQIAAGNAPDSPNWDSVATALRRNSEATEFDEFDVSRWLGHLREGTNILAIHGLNRTVGSNDFLIAAELQAERPGPIDAPATARFFQTPSPGQPNGLVSYAGLATPVSASIQRGFYDQPLDVVLSTNALGSTLLYTTDGSPPSLEHGIAVPAANSATAPSATVHVSTTTTLRYAVVKDDFLPSSIGTQTYIFLDDVINQPANPRGWPTDAASWGGFTPDYEMDPDVVGPYSGEIKDDLRAIPTISIVTDMDSLFGATGILRKPTGEGLDYERLASVELINPDGSPGFQVNSAIRVAGSNWARTNIAKRGFRLLFKDSYGPNDLPTDGPTSLEYPLFADTPVTSFNSIVLKGRADHSYVYTDGIRAMYVREHWGRDTMRDMGYVTTHGTYAHLYLNGLYWGLYAPFERPDGAFQADYQGGDADQWFILNGSSGWKGELGTDPVWRQLLASEDYETALQYLDVDNFIDYMMVNFYSGNVDWPDHNWWAARQNEPGAKYQFFQNDTEMTFYGPRDTHMDGLTGDPARLYYKLIQFPEFRLRFADRVQVHMFNDGALTPDRVASRWMVRATEIYQAIVGESARWGDNRRSKPYTRDLEWVAERDRLLNQFFPTRTDFMVEVFRGRGLYSAIDAPSLNQRGGLVPSTFNIELTAPQGTIYYTTDGSDPRLPGGQVNPRAIVYTGPFRLTDAAPVRTRALMGDEWSALDEATFIVDAIPASAANLRISEINYNPAAPTQAEINAGHDSNDDFEFIELVNTSDQRIDLRSVHFEETTVDGDESGLAFDFGTASIVYLQPGGRVVIVEDPEAFAARYGDDRPVAGQWIGRLSNGGEQITVMSGDEVIQQFAYSDEWYRATDGDGYTLEIIDASGADLASWGQKSSWRPSIQLGGSPGTESVVQLPGDSNHDGIFSSPDLVLVMQAGEYEDNITGNSTFEEGDWDGDGDFTTSDLILALETGTYVVDARMRRSDLAAAVDFLFGHNVAGPPRPRRV
jgi:hypothetical protein